MALRIVWARPALTDLQGIKSYLTHNAPGNASRVTQRIIDAIGLLANQPYLGRQGHVASTRELVISGLPYIVVYGVIENKQPNEVAIYHIYHGAQDWQSALDDELSKE